MRYTVRSPLALLGAAARRWLDSGVAYDEAGSDGDGHRIDWMRAVPFIGMHLGCLAVFLVGWSTTSVLVAVGLCTSLTAKEIHVSPFMEMDMRHEWRFTTPASTLTARVVNRRSGERLFDATLSLTRREATGRNLARALLVHPFMTFKVIAAIHWQALKLWLKGVPFVTHPSLLSRKQL